VDATPSASHSFSARYAEQGTIGVRIQKCIIKKIVDGILIMHLGY
jgi:hypothetical protein